jgi:nucleoid DNA-binding protein
MDINLFSKCIKDLIVENDRVDVPYLGSFTAEMLPATYSDHQTTIHPPYRKMSFHKEDVSLEQGRLLLEKVMKESDVSLEQAGVELGWCLSRLSSELEGHKSCKLPGLGVMRANARNEFFFVPDDHLDIWPDGVGFEPVSIKVSEKEPERELVPERVVPEPVEEPAPEPEPVPAKKPVSSMPSWTFEEKQEPRRQVNPVFLVLAVLAGLIVLFIIAAYLFTDEMSPILDRLLYTKEELELLRR